MIPENTESTMSGESHKNKIYKKKKIYFYEQKSIPQIIQQQVS
jgi:hypothetical protein